MNKTILRSILLGSILLSIIDISFAQSISGKESQEPKASFNVNINGKNYKMIEGEPLQFNESFEHPSMTIKQALTKQFNNGLTKFDFPTYYSFEYEESVGFKNWTLNGRSVVMMFFEMSEKVDKDDFAGRFIDKFGRKNCKSIPLDLKLGSKTLKGTKINVEMVGQKLNIYFVEVPLADKRSGFIYIQDVITNEPITKECQDLIEMMDASIEYL